MPKREIPMLKKRTLFFVAMVAALSGCTQEARNDYSQRDFLGPGYVVEDDLKVQASG